MKSNLFFIIGFGIACGTMYGMENNDKKHLTRTKKSFAQTWTVRAKRAARQELTKKKNINVGTIQMNKVAATVLVLAMVAPSAAFVTNVNQTLETIQCANSFGRLCQKTYSDETLRNKCYMDGVKVCLNQSKSYN